MISNVYFGAEEWDGPLNLREMYADCDETVFQYVADYRVNLITPSGLSDIQIDEFQTNLREIMRYIKYSNDKKKLEKILSTEQRFKNVERSAVEIINAVTKSNMKIEEGKESVDMCLSIQEMKEESRNKGEIEGAIKFAKELGICREEVKKSFMVKYQKSEQETEELMEIYWK